MKMASRRPSSPRIATASSWTSPPTTARTTTFWATSARPGRLPVTGNETVLDAIQFAGGLIPTAAPSNIRLVRPAPPGACCEQKLPVNLAAIMSGGDSTTNYQLMPGDRIVVYRDPIVRTTIFIDRLAAPFQTVLNSMLQYSFTARSIEFLRLGTRGVGRSRRHDNHHNSHFAYPAGCTLSQLEPSV